MATGDLDGDGDPDAVLSIRVGPNPSLSHLEVRALENDGLGRLEDRPLESPLTIRTPAGLGALVLEDLDGDGDTDLLLGANLHLQARPFVYDFLPAAFPAGARLPERRRALGVGDLSGDGLPDLLAGLRGEPNRLYRSILGTGFEDVSFGLPGDAASTEAVALGDLDGDGDLDLVLGNGLNEPDDVYENLGGGQFARRALAPDPVDTSVVALGDLDGDSDLDVLLGTFTKIAVRRNDGAGAFAQEVVLLDGKLFRPVEAALVDTDGDGDLDVLADGQVLENDGLGGFAPRPGALPADFALGRSFAFGDLDGDTDVDLVRVRGRLPARVLLGNGAGDLRPAFDDLETHEGRITSTGADAGDLNGDGSPDVWIVDAGGSTLLFNTGDGAFVDVSPPLETWALDPRDVALVDVDLDGDTDAVLATPLVIRNDGPGGFTRSGLVTPAFAGESLAAGDLDGDGAPDLLVGLAISLPEYRVLYLNEGDGRLTEASERLPERTVTVPPGTSVAVNDVALVDVDGDGDLDAALAYGSTLTNVLGVQSIPVPNELLLNDGTGSFSDGSFTIQGDLANTRAVLAVDLDGNGTPEVLFGNGGLRGGSLAVDGFLAQPNACYEWRPTGLARTGCTLPEESTFGLAAADLDADGRTDLVETRRTTFPEAVFQLPTYLEHAVLLADGRGGYRPGPILRGGLEAVLVRDFDGDGDPDLFGERLWTNPTRQLRILVPDRAGKPLLLEVRGAPGTEFTLRCALAQAEIDEGARGVLRLDPGSTRLVASGVLDGAGSARVRLEARPHGASPGTETFWQALVGAPPRYTNLERAVVTEL